MFDVIFYCEDLDVSFSNYSGRVNSLSFRIFWTPKIIYSLTSTFI